MSDLSSFFLHELGDDARAKLAEFRAAIPEIAARVREESPEAAAMDKLKIWGIDIETQSDASDIILLKYIRAEEGQGGMARTKERLALTLTFRADVRMDDLREAELPDYFSGHDYISGYDVEGRPVTVSRFGGMDLSKCFVDTEAFVRYRAKIMEEGISLLKFEKGAAEDLCNVHDYSGVPLNPGQEVKAGINALSRVLGEHYPEFKGRTLFVNFPSVFAALWKAFSITIPERTRKKMDILPKGDAGALFRYIAPEVVPECLAGFYRRESVLLTNMHKVEVVTVPARGQAEIMVAEVQEQKCIAYELRACTLECAYDVIFVPSEASAEIPVKSSEAGNYLKVEDGIVEGKFDAPEAGRLMVRFRNEAAWFKSRLCGARAVVL